MTEDRLRREAVRETEIEENAPIATRIFRMKLRAEGIAASIGPGQFLNLYLNDGALLLPRPIGVADAEDDRVTLIYAVVGRGTETLSTYAKGSILRFLGPNGNGYDIDAVGARAILIGGGLGIPPLLFAAKRVRARGAKTIAVLGYRDEQYCLRDMRAACDSVYAISERAVPDADGRKAPRETDGDTGRTGRVTDLLAHLESSGAFDMNDATVLACGSMPMLRAVARWSATRGIPAQVSMEERMGCGYGACVGCTCAVKADAPESGGAILRRKVCADGPVFRADRIVWDADPSATRARD
ncbi:MAG: dihydroorotate dehydrogenase electron transfer subunit [Clostridiales Family XIII bacterium]|jgi:dihydroorotate dehydrogenase electron transfer subunit|nr:dihydroorotate dehydrogenase electron transfer subunit [Clostridiales Family XIII bacterium]